MASEDRAFTALIEMVVKRLSDKLENKWISKEEAMRLLKISSPNTLQKWRDEGKIRFSQPEKKIILYDKDSIMEFLEKHARDTF